MTVLHSMINSTFCGLLQLSKQLMLSLRFDASGTTEEEDLTSLVTPQRFLPKEDHVSLGIDWEVSHTGQYNSQTKFIS